MVALQNPQKIIAQPIQSAFKFIYFRLDVDFLIYLLDIYYVEIDNYLYV